VIFSQNLFQNLTVLVKFWMRLAKTIIFSNDSFFNLLIAVRWHLIKFSFVNNNISVSCLRVRTLLPITKAYGFFTSITFICQIIFIKLSHPNIVKLKPLFIFSESLLFFDVWIIVTTISSSIMNNDTNQLVVIIFSRMFKFKFCTFCCLVQIFLGVLGHVKLKWKFKIIIDFDSLHSV